MNKRAIMNNIKSDDIIPINKPYFDNDDIEAVTGAISSTFVSGDGPECRKFEEELAEYIGVKHALFLNSATAGLDMAFRAKNFKPGSEVIVPDFTFTSTALGPMLNNLKVVLVDVNPKNGNINPDKIEEKITDKTVAIAPIDYGGIPAEMDKINKLAKKYGLYVVHDTAQSIGAEQNGKKTGALADVSVFSFHGTKNLVVGEGGAILTNDDELAKKFIIIRDKGTDKHRFLTNNITKGYYEYTDVGNSYVQSNILGALARTQLQKIDWITKKRETIAKLYYDSFSKFKIKFPEIPQNTKSNWHLFNILIPVEHKENFIMKTKEKGVITNIHYHPLHINPLFQKECNFDVNDFPGAIKFYDELVRIPLYPALTNSEIKKVIKEVSAVLKILNLEK
jgi:dTDP-4-amino-4,6-dideoxygalactose transaminase